MDSIKLSDIIDEEVISDRLQYFNMWYSKKERKLFFKYIRKNDTEKLKTLCKCYSEKEVCPACFLINARKRYTKKFLIN